MDKIFPKKITKKKDLNEFKERKIKIKFNFKKNKISKI